MIPPQGFCPWFTDFLLMTKSKVHFLNKHYKIALLHLIPLTQTPYILRNPFFCISSSHQHLNLSLHHSLKRLYTQVAFTAHFPFSLQTSEIRCPNHHSAKSMTELIISSLVNPKVLFHFILFFSGAANLILFIKCPCPTPLYFSDTTHHWCSCYFSNHTYIDVFPRRLFTVLTSLILTLFLDYCIHFHDFYNYVYINCSLPNLYLLLKYSS